MSLWITRLLLGLLLLCGVGSVWQWMRPYELGQDSLCQVEEVSVRCDHGAVWLEIELTHRNHALWDSLPLGKLVNEQGVFFAPADARISTDRKTCQIRFWLEIEELSHEWKLQLQENTLQIKKAGAVSLENGQRRTYHQPQW
ncbi:MAG: hypothetical protein RI957_203 [Verrucomicrobiota bacterium]|jgi:hypothetical protein